MFKLIPIVENTTTAKEYKCKHGLSLYIETANHKILFDVGPNDLFLENAKKMKINIKEVDILILSHGHSDHGGGLKYFLNENKKAKIYVRASAFEPHYIKVLGIPIFVGIDPNLINDRFIFCDDFYTIDEELTLISGIKEENYLSSSNRKLFVKKNNCLITDDFNHEQNLIIKVDNKRILVSGCSHAGIINIINKAEQVMSESIDIVFGGMHLFNPPTHKYESNEYIDQIAEELSETSCVYYTFHCTGIKAYERIKNYLNNRIHYIGTGYTYSMDSNC